MQSCWLFTLCYTICWCLSTTAWSSTPSSLPTSSSNSVNWVLRCYSSSLCNWIHYFLISRPQSVHFLASHQYRSISGLHVQSPSPLYTPYCLARYISNATFKFTNNTTVIGQIAYILLTDPVKTDVASSTGSIILLVCMCQKEKWSTVGTFLNIFNDS